MSSLQFAPGGNAPIKVDHLGCAYVVPAWVVARDYPCVCDARTCTCLPWILTQLDHLEEHAALMAWSELREYAELDPDGPEFSCAGCGDGLLRADAERCGECLVGKGG